MGWLWNSSSSKKDESQPTQPPPAPAPAPSTQGNLPTPPQQQPQKLSREEQADAEFAELWQSLKNDISQTEPQQSSATSTQSPASNTQSTPGSIAPESLYPDTMSCRSAFDYAFFCQSLGGQFVNVYRYGELRSCSEHWENFWLCMKTRTFGDNEKRRVIREHNRRKAIKYKTGPSSEDVWEVRMEPVKSAFQGDFAALEREMEAEEKAQAQARHPSSTI